jgi:hypothetical protein
MNFLYKVTACIVPNSTYGVRNPDDSLCIQGPAIHGNSTSSSTYADDLDGMLNQSHESMHSRIPCLADFNWGTFPAQYTCSHERVTDLFCDFEINENGSGKVTKDDNHRNTNTHLESELSLKIEKKETSRK